jgi:DNA-binding NarL/FixJ family response regulator
VSRAATDSSGSTVAGGESIGDPPAAPGEPLKILVADDEPAMVGVIGAILGGAGHKIIAAYDGREAIRRFEDEHPDLVLLDLAMPGLDGYECLAQLRDRYPAVRAIVVSATDDEENIRRALDYGAVCFVGKATDPHDLAGAVHVLLSDSIHLEVPRGRTSTATAAANGAAAALLTPRELEILRLASDGLSNSEMAKQLWVTDQTVKFHLSNIYRKLEVSNRTGASRWAREHGLLDDPNPASRASR